MKININTWTGARELDYCPKHFTATSTPLTEESKLWVFERLNGRFHIHGSSTYTIFDFKNNIYFEDPQEAVLYELTWS